MDYCDVFISCLDSFWRHPFTAEEALVSKWCNAKFLQICSDVETNFSSSWIAWEWGHFQQIYFLGERFHTKLELCVDVTLAVNIIFVIVWTQGNQERERDWLFPCGFWSSDPDSCGIHRIENSWRRNVIWNLMFWNLLASRSQTQHVLACLFFAKSILASHLSDCQELKRSTKESIAQLWSHFIH